MILLLGGTSDSIEIAAALKEAGIDFTLSVVTAYGRDLYSEVADRVVVGAMDGEAMVNYIQTNGVTGLVDATHPYAREASVNSIWAAEVAGVKYLRYERPSVAIPERVKAVVVDSVEEAAAAARAMASTVFLTTGSKDLQAFVSALPDKRLIARVLPSPVVLKKCRDLGIPVGDIVAVKGPCSYELNRALFSFYNADAVVTKESGTAGGFVDKLMAAGDLGLPVIVVRRPQLPYPELVSDCRGVVDVVKTWKTGG